MVVEKHESPYPAQLVRQLRETVLEVLEHSFATTAESGNPFVTATSVDDDDVCALVRFLGKDAEGHLLISSTLQVFSALRQRVLPERPRVTRTEAGDLAGELGNVVIGRLNVHLRGHLGGSFDMGTPVVVYGANVRLHRATGKPSVGLPFTMANGTLYVELSCTALLALTR